MSAMIVPRRGQQAMFSKFFGSKSWYHSHCGRGKSYCKEKKQKLRMKNIRGMFDDTQAMQEAQR